jgi:hypothetical protein
LGSKSFAKIQMIDNLIFTQSSQRSRERGEFQKRLLTI